MIVCDCVYTLCFFHGCNRLRFFEVGHQFGVSEDVLVFFLLYLLDVSIRVEFVLFEVLPIDLVALYNLLLKVYIFIVLN